MSVLAVVILLLFDAARSSVAFRLRSLRRRRSGRQASAATSLHLVAAAGPATPTCATSSLQLVAAAVPAKPTCATADDVLGIRPGTVRRVAAL